MIAYCGLDCDKCEALIATATNDDALRAKVAKQWSEAYGAPVKPEHINCTGCASLGVRAYYCEHMCEIRKCASGKNLGTCAECASYPCGHLEEVFKFGPQAKEVLDALRGA
jgi:hypothetical protein